MVDHPMQDSPQQIERKRVLLVDDEPYILETLKRSLHKSEFEILTATSGPLALEILNRCPVDAVVSDEHMPGMTGTELLSIIRDSYPNVPRIILTGNADMQVVIKSINQGNVDRYLTKPTSTQVLVNTISEVLLEKESRQLLYNLACQEAGICSLEKKIPNGIEVWSPSSKSTFGLQPDDALESLEDLWPHIHPDDLPKIQAIMQIGYTLGMPDSSEFRIVLAGGGMRWFNVALDILPRRMLALFKDINERKRVESELQISNDRFNEIAKHSRTIVWEVNFEGLYTYISESSHFVLGYYPKEIVSQLHFYDLHPENGREELASDAFEIFHRHEPFINFENQIQTKDGNILWVDTNGIPVFGSDGKLNGYRGLDIDITMRKQAEDKLSASMERAEAANKAKSQFLANMSHELRTPFNGILGMLQLLETTEIDDDQKGYITIALKSGQRMMRLLSDIVDISKIESGMQIISQSEFSPAHLLNEILSIYTAAFSAKRLAFRVTVEDSTPDKLVGDDLIIKKILGYLVGNALNFTNRGEIVVTISALSECNIGKCTLMLTVSDTGIGISEEKINSIFDLFTQADESNTRRFQGLGLGLTNCNRLVQLLNGTMHVESEIEKGLTFSCKIECGLPKSVNDSIAISSKRILVVEDDEVGALTISTFLTKAGHIVTAVGDGMVCLETLSSQDFDLILMDIQMPVMDGIDATKEIRKHGRFGEKSNIPIIALTAYAMVGDKGLFRKRQ